MLLKTPSSFFNRISQPKLLKKMWVLKKTFKLTNERKSQFSSQFVILDLCGCPLKVCKLPAEKIGF